MKFLASAILNSHEQSKCQDVLDSEADEEEEKPTKIRDPRADVAGDIHFKDYYDPNYFSIMDSFTNIFG